MSDRFWDEPPDDKQPDDKQRDKTEGVRIIGAEEAAEAMGRDDVAQRRGEGEPRFGDRPATPPEDVRPAIRFPLPADDTDPIARPRPMAPPAMQHWADPPTGEVPRSLAEPPEEREAESADDLEAWSGFAAAPRWRDAAADWEDADFGVGSLGRGVTPSPLASSTTDDDELFATFAPDDPVAPPARRSAAPPRPRRRAPTGAGGGRDLPSAVITGAGLAVVALTLFKIGNPAPMILVTGLLVFCSAEFFGALQRGGYQPATLLGLVATGGMALAAYWRGEAAVTLVLALSLVFTLLWYLLGVTRANPLMNAGVTVVGIGMVGLLGSFAALILRLPDGIGLLIGVLVAVVANDIGAYLVGQQWGRAPVAPNVSPGKTVEGIVGGAVASVLFSWVVLVLFFDLTPWGTEEALLLGLVVAVVAPVGDLCESMLKRDLGVKDMGSVLPGHGGIYDRFDSLLFALPAAFYLFRLLDLA
ncbi:MAG: phosphatidate cytidylyltransferase [Acidimicrobiia bacterium]